jgi:hypothetical protein
MNIFIFHFIKQILLLVVIVFLENVSKGWCSGTSGRAPALQV